VLDSDLQEQDQDQDSEKYYLATVTRWDSVSVLPVPSFM